MAVIESRVVGQKQRLRHYYYLFCFVFCLLVFEELKFMINEIKNVCKHRTILLSITFTHSSAFLLKRHEHARSVPAYVTRITFHRDDENPGHGTLTFEIRIHNPLFDRRDRSRVESFRTVWLHHTRFVTDNTCIPPDTRRDDVRNDEVSGSSSPFL